MRLGTVGRALKSVAAILAVAIVMLASLCSVQAAANVLPPKATPLGWSLDDMANAVANFSISGNDPAYYPETPFQIIYRHPNVP